MEGAGRVAGNLSASFVSDFLKTNSEAAAEGKKWEGTRAPGGEGGRAGQRPEKQLLIVLPEPGKRLSSVPRGPKGSGRAESRPVGRLRPNGADGERGGRGQG